MDFKKYNIFTPKDLFDFCCRNLRYGFKYREKVFTETDNNFQQMMDKLYKIRLKDDFVNAGYGVCWDFCEFEREFFEYAGIEHECYFLEAYEKEEEGGPTHTFTLFKEGDKWSWFEFSWGMYAGIWQYSSKEEALVDIVEKFKNFNNANHKNTKLIKTSKVGKRLDVGEFIEHCYNGKKVDVRNL